MKHKTYRQCGQGLSEEEVSVLETAESCIGA